MGSLTALDACLSAALHDLAPVPAEVVPLVGAVSHVLAADLTFPADAPATAEALRPGLAISALAVAGASAQIPVPLGVPVHVRPGDVMPRGTDAVLPEDGTEVGREGWEAIRDVAPGEGVRRAGHDGRTGTVIASAGVALAAKQALVAEYAGLTDAAVRRPRVAVRLPDPALAAFATNWVRGLGAVPENSAPHLVLRPAEDDSPRLALAPGETAWLVREAGELVLTVPRRVDGAVASLLALGLPALAALSGARPGVEARPLVRKTASTLGLSDLVLLRREGVGWHPALPGTVTLAALATADAVAVLSPDSEGLPEGAVLAAMPLCAPFGG